MGTCASRNPLAGTNPLRSIPLIRPAESVFGSGRRMGMPSLKVVAETEAVAAEIRATKRAALRLAVVAEIAP